MNQFEELKEICAREGGGKRKLVIYGAGHTAKKFIGTLEKFHVNVDYIVCNDWEKKLEEWRGTRWGKYIIKDPYDLIYEDIQSIFCVVSVGAGVADEVKGFLEDVGLKEGVSFVMQGNYFMKRNVFDPFLGYALKEYPPLIRYGEDYEYRVVVLGGSTSEENLYGIKAWPKILQEIIKERKVTIYNAAVGGYASAQELIKLIRDVVPMQPNMVILYDGYNEGNPINGSENGFPLISNYLYNSLEVLKRLSSIEDFSCGMRYSIETGEVYLQNVKMMQAICETFSIKFYAIYQDTPVTREEHKLPPCLKEYLSDVYSEQDLLLWKKQGEYLEEQSAFENILIDGRNILCGKEEYFIDACHVVEEGNEIIAQFIYNLIKEDLPEIGE